MANFDTKVLENDAQPGVPSDFTCPDCGGVLRILDDGTQPPRFRCQVGHAWGGKALAASQVEKVEESLWAALRILEEHSKLTRKLLDNARTRKLDMIARSYEERLADITEHEERIRSLLLTPLNGRASVTEET